MWLLSCPYFLPRHCCFMSLFFLSLMWFTICRCDLQFRATIKMYLGVCPFAVLFIFLISFFFYKVAHADLYMIWRHLKTQRLCCALGRRWFTTTEGIWDFVLQSHDIIIQDWVRLHKLSLSLLLLSGLTIHWIISDFHSLEILQISRFI